MDGSSRDHAPSIAAVTSGQSTFTASGGAVWWGTIRLRDQDVEAMLDLFEHAHEPDAFNDLYDAHLAAGGIERVNSFRKAA